jgi:hypothetical protein
MISSLLPPSFPPLICPHAEFKGSPEYYATSVKNYTFSALFLLYSNTYLRWLVYGDPSSQPPSSADTHTESDNYNLGGFLRRHAYAVVSSLEL